MHVYVCLMFKQLAQNYFMHAAEAGNANAMAFLGKVTFISFYPIMLSLVCITISLLFDEQDILCCNTDQQLLLLSLFV